MYRKLLSFSRTNKATSRAFVAPAAVVAASLLFAASRRSKDDEEQEVASISLAPPQFSLPVITHHSPTLVQKADSFWNLLSPITTAVASCEHHDALEFNYTFLGDTATDDDDKKTKGFLGEGAYATVHLAKDNKTGDKVAIKSIDRASTDRATFNREMRAMQYILQYGGHPHICSLHDYYEGEDYFYVIMDYVSGGEMFDHLIQNGAYSEADAARFMREVASALAFLHGMGVVHADLKPENLMLEDDAASGVKLVDFGCTQIPGGVRGSAAFTPAYAPPEMFANKTSTVHPPVDMWALGVILYIMLVGLHPFVLQEKVSDDELEERIVTNAVPPPIRNSPVTAHLSPSAIELLERLMDRDPKKRMTASEMLEHPWVRGETATTETISGSAERLMRIRAVKTKLQANFLQDVIQWSDAEHGARRQTSPIEYSFKAMYAKNGGFLPLLPNESTDADPNHKANVSLSMAEFTGLLSENMKHKFFPRNHIIYNEGDVGNHMYIINSGTIEVTTSNGSRAERSQGDFFGEGALLHQHSIRSGTIRCKTPVHVIEIDREYFEKYLQSSELGLMLAVKEKDRIRKRNRAKMLLRMQDENQMNEYKKGDYLYQQGEDGDYLYIVESGLVRVSAGGEHVFTATKGNFCGEQSIITGLKRNSTAKCTSERCVVQRMAARDFRRLMDMYPDAMASIRDVSLRRDFKKAVAIRLKKEFPYNNPSEAFHAVGLDDNNEIGEAAITRIMREMDPDYTKEEIRELIKIMDVTNSGTVSFEEFKKVFIADLRTSASI